jgi:glycosyltransferase involved in cell wall biosynthesis
MTPPTLNAAAVGPIAFFLPSLVGGGAERMIVNLARGIADRGFVVHLVLARAEGPYLADVPPSVRIVDLRVSRVLASFLPLVRYLRRARPAVLLSALGHANVVAVWARVVAGVPTRVVMSAHNTLSQAAARPLSARARLVPLLLRVSQRRAHAVVAVSRGVAEDFARTTRTPLARISVVPNPVVTPELHARARKPVTHRWLAPGEPPVLLGVGRLTWEKDFSTLIRAFALVRQRRPARLLILGEGPDRAALELLVRELGVSDDVELPGFEANPYGYMRRAAAFVLSSASEGLPTVLIEALASGTSVVSTDCRNGPREILDGGRLGRLVPVGDVETLAAAILDALERPATGASSDAWRPFSLEVAVDRYLDVLGMGAHA